MSECNYCILKRIESKAKENKAKIHIIANNIYVVEKGSKLDTSDKSKQWCAWMMYVPSNCCC